jgi:GNAT superfamily N-acetyltransferase
MQACIEEAAPDGRLAESLLSYDIRPLTPAELSAAGKLLVSVFDDDPWLRWVYRTADQRRLLLELNLMSYLRMYATTDSERTSNVLGTWMGDSLVSLCFYVEPAARANEEAAANFFESIKRACSSLPNDEADSVYQRFLYIEKDCFGGPVMNFRDDCYYLFLLACHPGHRRHGLGSLHVRRLMDLAFSRGFGVYLDTFNDDINDHGAFYSKFGFCLLRRSALPGQELYPDLKNEHASGQLRSRVVNDTLIAWPTLQSRIDNALVSVATPLPVAHTDSSAITSIGELRNSVWRGEGPFQCEPGCWTDEYDSLPSCYHWAILDGSVSEAYQIVASARLTYHAGVDDHRDIKIFKDYGERSGKPLLFPVADLGRLVVAAPFRCRGYAQQLNRVRIQAAKDLGCASVVVTASEKNAKLLRHMGFVQLVRDDNSQVTVVFDDRPTTIFYALVYVFS